ncbi:hypothetical protein QTN47_17280 [Danxiaibacter flavus]|uniref:RagB/SusD domain-containing protein n=1 Tax=Danxiaibacter flavus TaxID=3049108 RepID=A0ABV3ZIE0_9BACT|nr:hypothetical protein QNM32_17290 [Chitinophagaceae bacterium DXS]
MKRHTLYTIVLTALLLGGISCKKQLDVENPNQPSLSNAQTESGIISLAMGAVYINGFQGVDLGDLNWLGDTYFSLAIGFHELLGDNISAEASNQNINVVNLPDYVILDNGSKITNSSPSKSVMRISNSRDKRASNAFYYEWSYLYSMNNACNNVLDLVDGTTFSGDSATKKNTIKAWAYFWKGFAYSRIGSIYYSAVITNTTNAQVSDYKLHDEIVTEANKYLDMAASTLQGINNAGDYTDVLSKLIPSFTQTGHGGVLTTDMWVHNINTLKARNLLVNKAVTAMTAADWKTISDLSAAGVQEGDYVFTGRTTDINGFFSAGAGSVAAMTTGNPNNTTFKISERLIQDYKTGDKRLDNNFSLKTYLNQVGGFTFSTRYALVDAGNGIAGTAVLTDKTPGNYELYIAGSYEENALMQAESKIYAGDIEGGLQLVDKVRTYQGAGIAAVAGTGLTLAQAKEELRRERRVSLVFRGTSFYDARRWGVIYDVSKGGGRRGCVVLTPQNELNTNATINYNFLDYWDVPADESDINIPSSGSAPIKNPD